MSKLIRISETTYKRLTESAKYRDSFESIIRKLLEQQENECIGLQEKPKPH